MTLSRRSLLHLVGNAGGVAAAYHTMAAMGLLAVPSAYAGPSALPPGRGRRVVIIGAGIAGMVLAYELRRAGYHPLVLEARTRPGGRNWSLRGGDTVTETATTQHVAWDRDDHLYFNPGPARLPYHHEGILSYCRTLGVPLEVLCNDNRAALMQDDHAFEGAPQLNRRVVNDARGYVAELAAKAVDKDLLAQPVTAEDKDRLRSFLRGFGALDKDMAYHGSARAGWAEPPDATQPGTANQPLDLQRILQSDFWQGPMQFGELSNMAATMLQPVGGMGRIGQAFGRALAGVITYQAVVTRLHRTETGAQITWKHAGTGAEHHIDAPCVVVTVPFSALGGIDTDFSPATRTAMQAVEYIPAGKVAFQASRRFWELDQQIYGGISWTSRDATQMWYPSGGLQQTKGILVGAYIWSEGVGNAFAAKPLRQRLHDTLDDVAHLHPQAPQFLANGISVSWKNVPYTRGGWAEWSRKARATQFPMLLKGDGPYLFAGEHMSFITGWQEGAVRSAHKVLADIGERMRG
ncbi:FAD-dependent oxidoreductase [Acidisphaera sp. S103]|uniref:flavin monoamine oxidase family protein n=1 Tax=Acidisphaera sp. S103 TaxID=1747223 RepID=UPI00131CA4DD|nr:FAD-dependent oxidoreductase [Acidisphaera sp. S103]